MSAVSDKGILAEKDAQVNQTMPLTNTLIFGIILQAQEAPFNFKNHLI